MIRSGTSSENYKSYKGFLQSYRNAENCTTTVRLTTLPDDSSTITHNAINKIDNDIKQLQPVEPKKDRHSIKKSELIIQIAEPIVAKPPTIATTIDCRSVAAVPPPPPPPPPPSSALPKRSFSLRSTTASTTHSNFNPLPKPPSDNPIAHNLATILTENINSKRLLKSVNVADKSRQFKNESTIVLERRTPVDETDNCAQRSQNFQNMRNIFADDHHHQQHSKTAGTTNHHNGIANGSTAEPLRTKTKVIVPSEQPHNANNANVNKNDPNVRKLVYNTYRGFLGAYNDRANDMVATLPRRIVKKDQGVARQLETIRSAGVVPPPPPPGANQYLPNVRLKSEIPNQREPPLCVQNAMMTKDKKPFTYTPGGLDLSEIRSPRMARRLEKNAQSEGVPYNPQQQHHPNNNSYQHNPMQCGPVQVFPSGAPPPPPPQPHRIPPPPLPRSASASPIPKDAFERPDMTKIIPENPMALLRKTAGPVVKQDPIFNREIYARTASPQNVAEPVNGTTSSNFNNNVAPTPPTLSSNNNGYNKPSLSHAQPAPGPGNFAPKQSVPVPTSPPTQRQQPQQQQPVPQTPLSKAPRPWLQRNQQQTSQDVPAWAVNETKPPADSPGIKVQTPQQQQQQQQQPGSQYLDLQQPAGKQWPPNQQQTTTPAWGQQQTTTPAWGQQQTTTPAWGQQQTTTPAWGQQRQYQPQQQQPQQQQQQEQQPPQKQQPTTPPWAQQQPKKETPAAPWLEQQQQQKQQQQQTTQPQQQYRNAAPVGKYQPGTNVQSFQPPQQQPTPSHTSNTKPIAVPRGGGVRAQVQNRENPQDGHPPTKTEVVIVNEPPVVFHGPQQITGSRIIPVQIESRGSITNTNKPSGNQDRTFVRQSSWGNNNNGSNNPIQSNTFKVLQKITNTDGEDDEEEEITEHSPKTPSHFPQRPFTFNDNNGGNTFRLGSVTKNNSSNGTSKKSSTVRTIPIQIEGTSKTYVPPSEQTVSEPKMYMGGAIPSRSFKILQAMTSPANTDGTCDKFENCTNESQPHLQYPTNAPPPPPPPPHFLPYPPYPYQSYYYCPRHNCNHNYYSSESTVGEPCTNDNNNTRNNNNCKRRSFSCTPSPVPFSCVEPNDLAKVVHNCSGRTTPQQTLERCTPIPFCWPAPPPPPPPLYYYPQSQETTDTQQSSNVDDESAQQDTCMPCSPIYYYPYYYGYYYPQTALPPPPSLYSPHHFYHSPLPVNNPHTSASDQNSDKDRAIDAKYQEPARVDDADEHISCPAEYKKGPEPDDDTDCDDDDDLDEEDECEQSHQLSVILEESERTNNSVSRLTRESSVESTSSDDTIANTDESFFEILNNTHNHTISPLYHLQRMKLIGMISTNHHGLCYRNIVNIPGLVKIENNHDGNDANTDTVNMTNGNQDEEEIDFWATIRSSDDTNDYTSRNRKYMKRDRWENVIEDTSDYSSLMKHVEENGSSTGSTQDSSLMLNSSSSTITTLAPSSNREDPMMNETPVSSSIDVDDSQPSLTVKDRIASIETNAKVSTLLTLPIKRSNKVQSRKNSTELPSDDDEYDDDSGVTSDLSRYISENEYDPDCSSATITQTADDGRKMNKYQRAATHSRLYQLLQDECDAIEHSDDDECHDGNRGMTHQYSELMQKRGPNRDINSDGDGTGTNSLISSTGTSTPARTPQEFYDYHQYYNSWLPATSDEHDDYPDGTVVTKANQRSLLSDVNPSVKLSNTGATRLYNTGRNIYNDLEKLIETRESSSSPDSSPNQFPMRIVQPIETIINAT